MILDFAKKCEKGMLVTAILTLILGVVLVIEPESSIKVLTSIVAIAIMVIGGVQIVDYIRQKKIEKMRSLSLVLGVILLSLGIYLMYNLKSLVTIFTTIIGITISIKSLFKIQYAFNVKSISKKWFYNLIIGLVTMILGVILIFNPFASAELFLRIIGIILVIASVVEFITTILVMKSFEETKELSYVEKVVEEKEEAN